MRKPRLPIRAPLAPVYACSSAIAVLVGAASVAGLAYRTVVYPTDALLRTFVANDVANLAVGLPLLLGSMVLAWRGRPVGLLAWPGALLFVLYTYIAYVFAIPMGPAFLAHLAIVLLSAYTLVALVASIHGRAVRESVAGKVHEKLAGAVLTALGGLFFLRAIGVIVNALASGAAIPDADLAVNVADFLVAPAWVVGGVLLWRGKDLGYVTGLGLLVGIAMLFVALLVFLLVQPLLTAAPLSPFDIAVIAAMSPVGIVPLFLFARGVRSSEMALASAEGSRVPGANR